MAKKKVTETTEPYVPKPKVDDPELRRSLGTIETFLRNLWRGLSFNVSGAPTGGISSVSSGDVAKYSDTGDGIEGSGHKLASSFTDQEFLEYDTADSTIKSSGYDSSSFASSTCRS